MVHQHDVLGNVSLHISLQFFFLVLISEEKLLLSEQQELCRVRLLLLTFVSVQSFKTFFFFNLVVVPISQTWSTMPAFANCID